MKKTGSTQNFKDEPVKDYKEEERKIYKSPETESRITNKVQSSTFNLATDRKNDDDKVRASVYLQGESTRTI